MKFKINLIAILSVLVLTNIGCEDEVNNDNNFFESKNIENIGIKHNQYVNDYLNNTNNKFDNTSSLLNDYYSYSITNNPELKEYETLLMNHSNEFNVNLNLTDIYNYIEDELELMKSQNEISDYMYYNLMNILNNPTLKNARERITIMQNNQNLNENERQRLNAFVNVLNASEFFWSNYNNDKSDDDDCDGLDSSEAALISDSVGGALWWWTGPAGALIAGGYSLITYNGIECID